MFGQSLLSGAFGGAACTTDTDQLFATDVTATSIATYQLNGVTTSIPSNTYPGTASNITYAAGKFDNAAVFNGSSSYIYNTSTSIWSSDISISAWFKTSANQRSPIVSIGRGSWTDGFELQDSFNYTIGFSFAEGSKYGVFNASIALDDGNWHHYVQVSNSSTAKFYLDGVEQTGITFGNGNSRQGSGVRIGRFFGAPEQWANGSIDQVRIFNTALPQAAITALYNETVATSSSASINYVDANPNSVAYYKMSNTTDQLGNFNGTATNVNFNTEGKFGFAGAFNGSSSNIEFSAGSFNDTTISVSAWINSASSAADQSIFNSFDYSGSTSKGFIWKKNANNTLTAQFYDNSGTQRNLNTTETITNNVWTNVVLTISTSEAKIYINNGTPVTLTQSNLIAFHSTTRAGIGSFRFTGGSFQQFFNGKIDQLRIYNAVLSAANVTKLYNEIECPAATVINSFNTVLYTGNNSSRSITSVGFKPDFTWIKARSVNLSNVLHDTLTQPGLLISNGTNALINNGSNTVAFTSNGFDLQGGGAHSSVNENGQTYVSWNWKGSGITDTNTDGTITSSVCANKEAGFSVVKYTGNENASQTVGHGLSSNVEIAFIKQLDGGREWQVPLFNSTSGDYLILNDTDQKANDTARWSAVSSTTFTIGNQPYTNASGSPYIAYCFTSIPGYSLVGSYNGTGASGNTIYIGFEPSFLIIKSTGVESWYVMDNKRLNGIYSDQLYANLSNAEGAGQHVDFITDGFKLDTTAGGVNSGSTTYIFLAIA